MAVRGRSGGASPSQGEGAAAPAALKKASGGGVSIEAKLALNVYKLDTNPHISIVPKRCRRCRGRYCLRVCPARLFTLDEKGDIRFNYEGCLECGTCLIACRECAIEWSYPKGGSGVQFRYG